MCPGPPSVVNLTTGTIRSGDSGSGIDYHGCSDPGGGNFAPSDSSISWTDNAKQNSPVAACEDAIDHVPLPSDGSTASAVSPKQGDVFCFRTSDGIVARVVILSGTSGEPLTLDITAWSRPRAELGDRA